MKIRNNKKIISTKQGFTIIESLVAIFILVISLTGPMVFSQSGLRASFVSRDQITAFYLAQDAIEYIKNVRDNNVLADLNDPDTTVDWLNGLGECFNNGCSIDTINTAISNCTIFSPGCMTDPDDPESSAEYLEINDEGKFVVSGGVEDSIFARHIIIEPIDNSYIADDQVEITVYVRWNTSQTIGVRQIVVKETMFNWALGI
jgi:prepilin-type N-terminal cleavage/methylation domain-containing protein